MNRREFVKGSLALAGAAALVNTSMAGSSIKSSVKALEEFATERIAASERELKKP